MHRNTSSGLVALFRCAPVILLGVVAGPKSGTPQQVNQIIADGTQIEQLPKYGGQCDTLHDVHGQVGPGKQVLLHVASLRFPPPSFLRGRSDARVTILVQLYTKVTFPGLMHSAQRVEYDINNDLIS
jgi:hypothetical protein